MLDSDTKILTGLLIGFETQFPDSWGPVYVFAGAVPETKYDIMYEYNVNKIYKNLLFKVIKSIIFRSNK